MSHSTVCAQCRASDAGKARLFLDGTRKILCGTCVWIYRDAILRKLCGKRTPKGDCSRPIGHSPDLDCRHDPIRDKREREPGTKNEPAMRQIGDLL